MQQPYDAEFYANQESGSVRAARVVVPIVLGAFPARSVVDVGCGLGTWLGVVRDAGVTDIRGYDGDYVDRDRLHVDQACFHAADLRAGFSLDRRFDLAMSLEVGEHLPAECADRFVALLTEAAPVVLFSAAIPGQGGTDHLNERWQDEWRASFAGHGYRPVDLVRPAIRGHPDVAFWYQQNIVVYCDAATVRARPDLSPVPDGVSLNLVHQTLYEDTVRQAEMWLSKAVRMLPDLAVASARRRLAGGRRRD